MLVAWTSVIVPMTMSDELIALVRSGYEALNRRDFDQWMQQLDPDVEVYELAEAPEPVVYRRPEGVRRWLEQQDEIFEEFSIEPTEIVVSGDVVLATVVLHGRGRGSSAPVSIKLFHVLNMRDGRVLRVRGFLNEADARHAAAAEESDKPD
jgi:ketosteroid isomerase-like protein